MHNDGNSHFAVTSINIDNIYNVTIIKSDNYLQN